MCLYHAVCAGICAAQGEPQLIMDEMRRISVSDDKSDFALEKAMSYLGDPRNDIALACALTLSELAQRHEDVRTYVELRFESPKKSLAEHVWLAAVILSVGESNVRAKEALLKGLKSDSRDLLWTTLMALPLVSTNALVFKKEISSMLLKKRKVRMECYEQAIRSVGNLGRAGIAFTNDLEILLSNATSAAGKGDDNLLFIIYAITDTQMLSPTIDHALIEVIKNHKEQIMVDAAVRAVASNWLRDPIAKLETLLNSGLAEKTRRTLQYYLDFLRKGNQMQPIWDPRVLSSKLVPLFNWDK